MREKGRLTTEELADELVRRSRPKRSETHHLFEWDAQKGHAIYLVERAKSLIMKVKCCFVEAPDEPVRSFPVVVSDGKKGPIAMQEVIGSRELMAAVLEQAKADLETWSRRYERLRRVAELRGVFGAIKGVVRKK
jgi:hypothetical protein